MKKIKLFKKIGLFSLIFLIFISGFYIFSFKKNNKLKVVKVIDGDTIVLSNGKTVRYIGINTPEIGQPCYKEATQKNKELVLGKIVKLEFDVQKYDKYKRLLAYVWQDDKFTNLELVKQGYANSFTFPPNVKYQDLILKAERFARENKLGCWGNTSKYSYCIKISNIKYNAKGDDNKNKNDEWIEIENICNTKIDLTGWLLKDSSSANQFIFPSFTILPKSKIKIFSGCGKNSNTYLFWQCPEKQYAIWNNSGDQAFLYDRERKLVDNFKY